MSAKWSSQALGGKTPDFGELLKNETGVILLQGKNPFGDLIYCYLKIAMGDIDRLKAALQSDAPFNASDFGAVVAAGKGNPPPELRAEMAQTYHLIEAPKPTSTDAASATVPAEKKNWDEY